MGDVVHIVEAPVYLLSSWTPQMNRYCGKEARIRTARMRSCGRTGCYNLDIDDMEWVWNDEAFQEFYRPVISEEEFLKILG